MYARRVARELQEARYRDLSHSHMSVIRATRAVMSGHVKRKVSGIEFVKRVRVVQGNALGDESVKAPDDRTAVMDPTTVDNLAKGPGSATGMSKQVAGWIHLSESEQYPGGVYRSIVDDCDARLWVYHVRDEDLGDSKRTCIHAACPCPKVVWEKGLPSFAQNLVEKNMTNLCANVYANVMEEFAIQIEIDLNAGCKVRRDPGEHLFLRLVPLPAEDRYTEAMHGAKTARSTVTPPSDAPKSTRAAATTTRIGIRADHLHRKSPRRK